MKTSTLPLLFAACLAAPVLAQQPPADHGAHHPPAAPSATTAQATPAQPAAAPQPSASDAAEGEVRRVDREGGRITLRHGEIRSLDMPPMTMVFAVRDKAVLERVKEGDKVRFRAVNEAGRFVVTEIEVLR